MGVEGWALLLITIGQQAILITSPYCVSRERSERKKDEGWEKWNDCCLAWHVQAYMQ